MLASGLLRQPEQTLALPRGLVEFLPRAAVVPPKLPRRPTVTPDHDARRRGTRSESLTPAGA